MGHRNNTSSGYITHRYAHYIWSNVPKLHLDRLYSVHVSHHQLFQCKYIEYAVVVRSRFIVADDDQTDASFRCTVLQVFFNVGTLMPFFFHFSQHGMTGRNGSAYAKVGEIFVCRKFRHTDFFSSSYFTFRIWKCKLNHVCIFPILSHSLVDQWARKTC